MANALKDSSSGLGGVRRGLERGGLVGIPHVQLREVQQLVEYYRWGLLADLSQQDNLPDLGGDVVPH